MLKKMSRSDEIEICSCGEAMRKGIGGGRFILSDKFYENSGIHQPISDKPYKGHYFKEDEDSNMG